MKKVLITLIAVSFIAACSQKTKQKWGLAQKAPDEFLVVSRAPLSLPPDYDLRPVNENIGISQETVKYQGLSEGERVFLRKVDTSTSSGKKDLNVLIDEELEGLDD